MVVYTVLERCITEPKSFLRRFLLKKPMSWTDVTVFLKQEDVTTYVNREFNIIDRDGCQSKWDGNLLNWSEHGDEVFLAVKRLCRECKKGYSEHAYLIIKRHEL